MDKINRIGDELTQRFEKISYPARLDVSSLLRNGKQNGGSAEVLSLNGVKEMRSYPSSPSHFHGSEKSPSPQRPWTGSEGFRSYSGTWVRKGFFKPKVGPSEPPRTPKKLMEEKQESIEITSVSEETHSTKLRPIKAFVPEEENSQENMEKDQEDKEDQESEQLPKFYKSGIIHDRLKNYASHLNRRMSRVREVILQPLTPSTGTSGKEKEAPAPPPLKKRFSALEKKETRDGSSLVGVASKKSRILRLWNRFKRRLTLPEIIEPQSHLSIAWLFVACVCYVYNAWMIPMRSVFTEYQTEHNIRNWFILDYSCDLVYVVDIFFYKFRVTFLKNGTWVTEPKGIRINYLKSHRFVFDLLSLTPLDFLYFLYGPISAFRFPRLLKICIFFEFFDRLDSVLSNPFIARMLRTVLYMIYTIHLNALVYYGMSKLEGIGSNSWVYDGVGNAYARCYYFAIKTAISIGKNPKPVTVHEQALMAVAWLAGVFVFAVLLGQVKDIVLTATKNKDEYRRIMDQTLAYLHKFNIPKSTMDRVRLWFSYTWESQKTLDEIKPLKFLPIKLQLDIAIDVHIQTLSKVQLFQDCDENLLRDLVLKLKPVIYLPGDYVCKKGEVGKEMYIVKMGHVQVVGGSDGNTVFATLSEGSVFGEISLLALGGGNRRTADVRSEGFSNLFVLSKEDLEDTIKDHPEAQKVLERKAAKLIRDQKMREKETKAAERQPTPKIEKPRLLSAVFEVSRKTSNSETNARKLSEVSARSATVSVSLKKTDENYTNRIEKCDCCENGEEILIVETTVDETLVQTDPASAILLPDDEIDQEIYDFCAELIENAVARAIEGVTRNPRAAQPKPVSATAAHETVFVDNPKYSVVDADKKLPLPVLYEGVLYPSSAFGTKKNDGLPSDEQLILSIFQKLAQEQLGTDTDDDVTYDGCSRSFCNSSAVESTDEDSSSRSVDQLSKKRGLIDLGSSVDSEEWEGNDLNSSKRMNAEFKHLSLGSLSSRDSFDHLEMTLNIPSTSSGSEIS